MDNWYDDTPKIEEHHKLRGYCDHCQEWYNFTRGIDKETCPKCGARPSVKNGLQLTTQRTPIVKGKKKR